METSPVEYKAEVLRHVFRLLTSGFFSFFLCVEFNCRWASLL